MFDRTRFVEDCKAIANGPDASDRMKQFLESALEDPRDVAANFDNRISRSTPPGELLLHRGPDLLIVRVALDPGYVAPVPHDHRMWAFVGIYQGVEENTLYRRHAGTIHETGQVLLKAGDILALDPTAIHAIANPDDQTTIGIHVYLGDLATQQRSMWNPRTLAEEPFEFDRFLEYEKDLLASV